MPRVTTYFNDARRKQIEDAVAAAESRTAAEIVPVVASASGRYDRPEDIVGLFTAFVLFGLTWYWYPRSHGELGSWAHNPGSYELMAFSTALIIGFVAGTAVASRLNWLRCLFTPKAQMLDEVNARARQVFFDSRVRQTRAATGILFYVSLYERTAVILADTAVTEILGQPVLDELCAKLVADLRAGDIAGALSSAILNAAEKLASSMPIAADDKNELPNELILID